MFTTKTWLPGTKTWSPVTKKWLPVTKTWLPVTIKWLPGTKKRLPVTKTQTQRSKNSRIQQWAGEHRIIPPDQTATTGCIRTGSIDKIFI